MFNESDSFYFCLDDGDVTSTLQRQSEEGYQHDSPLWLRADDRFFFNKHMLKDLLTLNDNKMAPFVLPLMQGHVEVRRADLAVDGVADLPDHYSVVLVSRRSRHRAGN